MIQAMAKMTANVGIRSLSWLLLKTTRLELGSRAWELPAGIRLKTWVLLSAWLKVLFDRWRMRKLAFQSIYLILLCFQFHVGDFGLLIEFRRQHHDGIKGRIGKGWWSGWGANWAGSKDFGGRMFNSGGGWSGEMNNGVSAGFEEILWSDFFVIRILAENEEISS